MAKERITKGLGLGIVTIPRDAELIPQQAAQDSLGWISRDGELELCKGKIVVGAAETANGTVQGEGWGYTVTGTAIHFRKINTKIQYYNTATSLWVDIVTGLTAGKEYTFSPYQSLAGTFMYVTGFDGIYKICTANPGSYSSMYDSTKNYKGKSIITQSRMSMWDVKGSLTTHFLSYTDSAQDSTVYTQVNAETIAAGDGVDTTFSGTLAFRATDSKRTAFLVRPYGQLEATKTITAISSAVNAQITAAGHNLSAGDKIVIEGVTGVTVSGTSIVNNFFFEVRSVVDANNITISRDTTGATAYSANGTLKKIELFEDNYDGTLTSQLGGTGTINYTTGAYALTFNTAPFNVAAAVATNYAWEMTNNKGVTDFTFSGTRTALQGDVVRQDEGGDAILNIVYHDGSYYSMKSNSVYKLTIASTGLTFENIQFRKNIGLPYWRSVVGTKKGIVFMDTSNLDKPQLTILQPNLQGDNLEPVTLANHFDFSDYVWDACAMDTFGEFIVFSGRTSASTINNKLFLYNLRRDTVDILPYQAKTITSNLGRLYIGDTITENVYEILSGFDDDGSTIENYWESNDEKYGTESLKKVKRLRFKGLITPDQILEINVSYDNEPYTLVGTIRGDGVYVDNTEIYTIGSQGIGTSVIGGESDTINGAFFFAELKLQCPKFRKRSIKIEATGIGYASLDMIDDFNIRTFAQKLPTKYRQKQNVSLDGTLDDQ